MKRIAILTDSINKIGGIESLIQLKANYWSTRKNYSVHIVTTEQKGQEPFLKMSPEVDFHDLGIGYDRNKSYFGLKNLPKVAKNFFLLQKKINQIKPDVVIVANHIPVSFFFIFLKTKARWVKEFHFSKFYRSKLKPTLFTRYEQFLESKYDHLVVLNPEERNFYPSENAVTIPNPVLTIEEKELVDYDNRSKIAIAAGRISYVKRMDILIDIWQEFVKHNSDWQLHIYGNGESGYVKKLHDKIESLHLDKYIKFMGAIDNVPEIMKKASLYLMTSSQECFPMVLLEAQSVGLPIISFDCPTGPRNIITHEYDGILVENDNRSSFVENLIKLASNEQERKRLANNGVESVQKYHVDAIMAKWDDLIIKSK
ncbi:glycosyltransferase family 4 protein [Spongiivirga citrea]|uniref:Glycosyltransferase n=1 Tax=Spongiivirga citrea TaxID=1481457 RepID=A0A6M0CNM8_9FLAO|nr:glycosyltransferase family 4 protein [Spongiivirga citrea]NER15580.1 glycosyltransferase [Spongiivirga citrea]